MSGPAPTTRQRAIAALNDAHRRQLVAPAGGRTVLTRGVAALPPETLSRVLVRVATFAEFTPDNDPYHEHDCAVFTVDGLRMIWKIDYYANAELDAGAEDPLTAFRLLTVMLAEEY